MQDVSELAFHSATNKRVSEKAMKLLILLEHIEEGEVVMQGGYGIEEDQDEDDEFYWTGAM
jgi:alpha-D-ribose 1-methylphosphonate 5-triphosphate synthase subunit PhnH